MNKKAVLILLLACSVPGNTFAQNTAFTYQGRLDANGIPVTGTYDLQFGVYDSSGGATVIGGPLTSPGVGISNGLFNVTLDFGAGVFTGPARWLQIAVRTNGGTSFVPLSPRQALTPSPYAIHAGTASNVVSGTVVKSLNNLKDNVTLAAGSNVTITPAGNSLRIDVPSGGSSNWFGSGGNTYLTSGNVGIGTTQPQGLLDLHTGVSDTSALFVRGDPGSFGRGGVIHHQSSTYGWQELAQTTGSPVDGYLTFHYVDRLAPGTKVASDVLTLRANGNVGIGTATPARRLTVYDTSYGIEHTDGNIRLGTYVNAGGWLGTISNHKLHFFVNDGFPSMTVDTTRNVGIGTTTPAAKLDINGSLLVRQDLTLEAGASPGLFTGTGGTEQNRYLHLLNSAGYQSASGLKAGGVLVSDSYGFANPGKNELIVKGNVSVGTPDTTQAKLHVFNDSSTAVSGVTSWRYGVYGRTTRSDSSSAGVYGEYPGPGQLGWAGYFVGPVNINGGLAAYDATFQQVYADGYNSRSDRNLKTNFASVDTRAILGRVLSLPIQTWNFTNQSAAVRHIGPMAQDFHAAFHVGQDDKYIASIDADGVALAAIQGLNQKLEDELKSRDAENTELKQRVVELEQLIKRFAERFSGGAQ